jgi:hypothetical protein
MVAALPKHLGAASAGRAGSTKEPPTTQTNAILRRFLATAASWLGARILPGRAGSVNQSPAGDTTITTFNVENLFDLMDDPVKDDGSSTPTPEELDTKLTKLSAAVRDELRLPEILIVQEIENTKILQELGDRVNAAAGTDYIATSFETSDVRGIEPGFLWDAERVGLNDAFQLSGADVEAAFGPSSASPGREPLVGSFDIEGTGLTIVANHLKSKSGDDALFGVNQPPIRITEEQRKLQAQVVRDFTDRILEEDPDAKVMVAGDLNDFPFGEPGEGSDHPIAILEGNPGQVPLTNLLRMEKPAETFTFVFDGNRQVLDHMLVSPALLDLARAADVLHFNSPFPESQRRCGDAASRGGPRPAGGALQLRLEPTRCVEGAGPDGAAPACLVPHVTLLNARAQRAMQRFRGGPMDSSPPGSPAGGRTRLGVLRPSRPTGHERGWLSARPRGPPGPSSQVTEARRPGPS